LIPFLQKNAIENKILRNCYEFIQIREVPVAINNLPNTFFRHTAMKGKSEDAISAYTASI